MGQDASPKTQIETTSVGEPSGPPPNQDLWPDRASRLFRSAFMALILALALGQFAIVMLRYGFGINRIWAQEAVMALHATVFMAALGWTLALDRHVRLDMVYARLKPAARKRVNWLGLLVFTLPLAATVLWTAFPYVAQSWAGLEGSPEIAGLPGRYLLKTLIPLSVLGLLVGAFALIVSRRGQAPATLGER